MKARRLLLLMTVAGLGLAACSAQETATPVQPTATSVPAATDTSTTTPPTTTPETTTPPTTTTPETTAPPTTTPPTTAAPAPSGDPTDEAVPVFAGSSLGPWLYVGRWTGDTWEGAFDADGQPIDYELDRDATVAITDITRGASVGEVGRPGESCFDERVGPVITPNAGAPETPLFGYTAIAVPVIDWPLQPRRVAAVDAELPAYEAAGVDLFAGDDVETQAGEVDQIVVADIDGDGDAESLVVFGDESGEPGVEPGFSGLFLIDTESGDTTTVAKSFVGLTPPTTLAPLVDEETGNVIEAPTPPRSTDFDTYRILDVVDLDGDGLMEIVVHTWYSQGAGVNVYTYDGGVVTEVLSTSCGS